MPCLGTVGENLPARGPKLRVSQLLTEAVPVVALEGPAAAVVLEAPGALAEIGAVAPALEGQVAVAGPAALEVPEAVVAPAVATAVVVE